MTLNFIEFKLVIYLHSNIYNNFPTMHFNIVQRILHIVIEIPTRII